MDTQELRYFVEAANVQNLTRAARTLGTTQSTLSHAIRRLEEEFDCKLFAKKGKVLRLTPQGRRFSERAAEILKNLHELKTEVGSSEVPLFGHVRVAGTTGDLAQIITHALLDLSASSRSTLDITNLRSSEILKKVAAKELDFGLCYEPQPFPGTVIKHVAASESVIVVRKSHPILKTKKTEQRLQQLLDYPWAHPRHLPGVAVCTSHPAFTKLGQIPKVRFFYDSHDLAAEILSHSDSWAILPLAVLGAFSESLRAILLKYTEPVRLALVSHEDSSPTLIEKLEKSIRSSAALRGWEIIDD